MEYFLGQIIVVSFSFAPRGFALCDGQLLSVNQNTALFSLLGTTYGGNGTTTFALPDLRGRVPMHAGNGVALSPKTLGQKGGAEGFTLNINQLPPHNHILNARGAAGNRSVPTGNALAGESAAQTALYSAGTPNVALNAASVGNAGNSQPVNVVPPYLTLNFAIALTGYFPSRN